MDLNSVLSTVASKFKKDLPIILAITGVAGFIVATKMAVDATEEALDVLEYREDDLPPEKGLERTIEQTKLLFPIYSPAIGVMMISAACVFAGHNVSSRRLAALDASYYAARSYIDRLHASIQEAVGEKKLQDIKESAASAISEQPSTLIDVGDGFLVYDQFSGRYFRSDSVQTIREAVNNLNALMYQENFATLNDFYYEIGLETTRIGEDVGWHIEDGPIEVVFGSTLTKDKKPCVTIDFLVKPREM